VCCGCWEAGRGGGCRPAVLFAAKLWPQLLLLLLLLLLAVLDGWGPVAWPPRRALLLLAPCPWVKLLLLLLLLLLGRGGCCSSEEGCGAKTTRFMHLRRADVVGVQFGEGCVRAVVARNAVGKVRKRGSPLLPVLAVLPSKPGLPRLPALIEGQPHLRAGVGEKRETRRGDNYGC